MSRKTYVKWSEEDKEELSRLRGSGLSSGEIARRMSNILGKAVTECMIEKACARFNISAADDSPDPSKPKTKKQLSAEGRIKALEGTVSLLKSENNRVKKLNGRLQEVRKMISSECAALKPPAFRLRGKPGRKKKKDFAPAVLMLGDWHIGEKITNEECGGWGDYNYDVATERVELLSEKLISWIEPLREGWDVPELIVFCVGDFVSGNIHKGLEISNEWPVPLAAVRAGDLLSAFAHTITPYFQSVVFHFLGVDNHGRLSLKPQFKQGADNNWNVVTAAVLEGRASDLSNINIKYHKANPAYINVHGKHVLALHGGQLRGWSGIPAYGMERFRGRKAVVHMERGEPFDLIVCGHFHQPSMPPGWIVNGSLCGTTELDHAVGRMAPPSQTSFLWSPKWGQFNMTNWRLG